MRIILPPPFTATLIILAIDSGSTLKVIIVVTFVEIIWEVFTINIIWFIHLPFRLGSRRYNQPIKSYQKSGKGISAASGAFINAEPA